LERRKDGLDGEQAADRRALLIVELGTELGGVHVDLALGGRHIAQAEEGLVDDMAAVLGQAAELAHGGANLLALRGGEAFHGLVALENLLALVDRHGVELREAIVQALLLVGGKAAEAGFIFKGALLLGEREARVRLHPLVEVLLGLVGMIGTYEILRRRSRGEIRPGLLRLNWAGLRGLDRVSWGRRGRLTNNRRRLGCLLG